MIEIFISQSVLTTRVKSMRSANDSACITIARTREADAPMGMASGRESWMDAISRVRNSGFASSTCRAI